MVKLTVWNDADKPHKGRFTHYHILTDDSNLSEFKGRQTLLGFYVDHPQFKNKWGNTSRLITIGPPNQFGYREAETEDFRYTLVGPELTWEQYVTNRNKIESQKHVETNRILSGRSKPFNVPSIPEQPKGNKKKNVRPYYSQRTKTRITARNSSN